MKKMKKVLFTLAVLLLLPISVFAKDKINVYIFKGEGCGYCARALAFFEGLDEEYKSYFNLVEKEVWNDKSNAALMQSVANYFNFEVKGVPFIVIGDKYFDGYTSSYDNEIKSTIKVAYENSDNSYMDVVAAIMGGDDLKKESNSTAFTIIIILAVVAGVGFLVYMAKDNSSIEDEEVGDTSKKEEKVASKKTTPSKTSTATKKSSSKTTNSKTKKTTSKTANSKKTTNKK